VKSRFIPEVNVVLLKVKLSLCFKQAQRQEGILGEWMYRSTHSLTSTLDGGEWSASRPGRFTPKKRAAGTHWIGGCVGSRADLDAVVKRKIPSPRRESNPGRPARSPALYRLSYHESQMLFSWQINEGNKTHKDWRVPYRCQRYFRSPSVTFQT
jgi:hypothetical protein